MVFHTTDFDRVAFQVFQYTGHIGVDLISKLLGTEERAAVLGRENRMNQQLREGLAHPYITTQNGVLFIQKRPPFQGDLGRRANPGLKRLGYSVDPLRGEENSDGVAMLTRTGGRGSAPCAHSSREREKCGLARVSQSVVLFFKDSKARPLHQVDGAPSSALIPLHLAGSGTASLAGY